MSGKLAELVALQVSTRQRRVFGVGLLQVKHDFDSASSLELEFFFQFLLSFFLSFSLSWRRVAGRRS